MANRSPVRRNQQVVSDFVRRQRNLAKINKDFDDAVSKRTAKARERRLMRSQAGRLSDRNLGAVLQATSGETAQIVNAEIERRMREEDK